MGAEADVRAFAIEQAKAVFHIWDSGGDFMARRAEARAAIDRFAADQAPHDTARVSSLQAAGFFSFIEHYCTLVERWDAQLEFEAAALGRSAGARRRRLHHVRSVFR